MVIFSVMLIAADVAGLVSCNMSRSKKEGCWDAIGYIQTEISSI